MIDICFTIDSRREITDMGWLRLVGYLNLQVSFGKKVSFAKEPSKRDYILQKRPVILRRLLIVGTPYYTSEDGSWTMIDSRA